MIFSHRTVKSFRLSVSPGGSERLVAFGPGAVLSGSVFLTLDKPLRAHNIRVVFRCEQKSNRAINTLFNVESIIWGKPRSVVDRAAGDTLKEGCHMYLFAIKLPNVNYPPSMQDNDLGYRVDYTLQGFLDLHDQRVMETAPARVMYLPLISCVTDELPPKNTQEFKRGSNNRLQLTLQAARPAYCPGDSCTVKLITKNRSEHKISSFQVALVAMASAAAAAAAAAVDKTHTVHSETIYVPIGKYANNTSVCNFQIPSHCAPSLGIITYQIVVTLQWGASSWKFPSSLNNVSVGIPITIATVPATYPVPPHLQLPLPSFLLLQGNGAAAVALPSFIPNIESPDPSPTSPVSIDITHSPSPSPSLNDNDQQSLDGRTLCDGWPGGGHHHHHHHYAASSSPATGTAGYLTVPSSSPRYHHHHHLRRSSTSSVLTDCSAEINSVISDSSSCTRVAVQ